MDSAAIEPLKSIKIIKILYICHKINQYVKN